MFLFEVQQQEYLYRECSKQLFSSQTPQEVGRSGSIAPRKKLSKTQQQEYLYKKQSKKLFHSQTPQEVTSV